MFNAFAKSLVLCAKVHCSAKEKAAIKKAFKLFDSSSRKYANDFAQRVLRHTEDGHNYSATKGIEILPGVTVGSLEANIPDGETIAVKGTMYGMMIAGSLAQDSTDDKIVGEIIDAMLSSSTDKLRDVVFDEDLMEAIMKVVSLGISDDVRQALVKIGTSSSCGGLAAGRSTDGIGLMQLAQEISQGLDMSTLMGVAGQGQDNDAAMTNLFASINRTVIERMQDGSIDPTRLCAEASSILGARGQLNGKM
jgi:hypothetical protein